jgi:hypothetical protein
MKEEENDDPIFETEIEDATGKKLPFKSILKGKATVIMLLRHFGW